MLKIVNETGDGDDTKVFLHGIDITEDIHLVSATTKIVAHSLVEVTLVVYADVETKAAPFINPDKADFLAKLAKLGDKDS